MVEAMGSPPDSEDAKLVAALDAEYQAAVEANDAEVMDRILADDMVLITGVGEVVAKAELLDEARRGVTRYDYQYDTDRTVRVWGDNTAVITALLWAKGTTENQPFEYRVWFSDTYVRTKTGWRYALGQASTRLPGDRLEAGD